ncbi:MAG: DUF4248 domain-containing protein [Prevotella sp.]|nr:DUF4248 domain-containing protein [Prevotella sp.]MBQ8702303.1 DUF4248 domain-containing protein [Prevotella sp.]
MTKDFTIRTYGRAELAQQYCPNVAPMTAYRKLNSWIDTYPDLRRRLTALGAGRSRTYTPRQVQIIVEALGEP